TSTFSTNSTKNENIYDSCW
ncbi:MAG: polyribonucleotide nucleotidyltransferase, partial [Spiroplasma phoeniceum]